MQSAPYGRRSRAKSSAERCCSAGSPEEMTGQVGAGGEGYGGAAGQDAAAAAAARDEAVGERTLQSHLHRHSLNSRKVRERCHWNWMVLLLWVLSWSLISFWILSSMSSEAVEMRQEVLASMCDERARMLEDQVNVSMNQLQALAVLISTFHHSRNPSAIDQITFARYAERTAFQRPLTRGLAYAVRVTHDERELFERQQAWSISMMNSSTKRSPAEEYAPVIFAEDALKHVISFDMLLGNEDRENVLRARASGKGVLSAPFKLFKTNRIGVVLTYAVYKSELPPNATAQDRIQSAIGYLGGVFDIKAYVDKLLHAFTYQSITVNVYDTTIESRIKLYGSNDTGSGAMCHVSMLNFGDPSRKHEMHCRFMQSPPWPWLAIISSYVTFVLSLLVGCIFHFTGKWIDKVEDGYKAADMQMPVKDGFTATERITEMERDLNERAGRGQIPPECASVRQWQTPILSINADVIQATHERCQKNEMDDYVSQPFEGEQLYREDARFFQKESPSSLELSYLANHHDLEELELDETVDQEEVEEMELDEIVDKEKVEELNLSLEVQHKLNDTKMNLQELGTRSKFITKAEKLNIATIHNLPFLFRYLNKKVVSVSLLGLVLYILVMRRGDDNMMLNKSGRSRDRLLIATLHDKSGRSRDRLLIATLHDTWATRGVQGSDMIRVDLRKITGNNDSSGQQKHWSSHNSSEIPAVLYVLRNGKHVKIHCNLIADEKALANWISNNNTVQSSKYQEATIEKYNGTIMPHLPEHKSHKTTVGHWIALVAVIILVLGTAVWLLLWCKCNRRRRVQQKELELLGGMGPRRFQLDDLAAATGNFTGGNKLGQGGFGPVYKGYLRDQDLHVAIKVLSRKQSSQEQFEQGLREFKAEVKVMTQLRHRNIVKLVGWCDSKKQLLLVYELMAQGSLDKHLYDPEKILTWQQRYKIVLDLASGLLYLHRDCEKCIVHGDIKPANVMLDVLHNAKLGDFGLARLVEHGGEPQTTQVVAGTPGYIDPEFINNRWPRTELDVYSFGVVLLEIACGKRPASRQPNGASSLLAWVRDLYDQGMILDAADPRLNGDFDQQQMERVIVTGLWCAHQDPIQRPSIVQTMDVLRSADGELPVLSSVHDAGHIRSMEEQAYADLPVEDRSVHAVTPSTYFTSKDSVYLLAEE